MAAHVLRADVTRPAGVDRNRTEFAGGKLDQTRDAFLARGEGVGQFPGHGDDVAIGAAHLCARFGERLKQMSRAVAKRRGVLHGFGDAAVLGARRLEMVAADVPADDNGHVASCAILPRYTMTRSLRAAQGPAMEVIPVLDLKEGVVVHARMGRRDQYRPIETPLASTSNPVDVARGLLAVHPFETFYIADLDAIENAGNNDAALTRLKTELPNLVFWVDNGVADLARANSWLDAGLGNLVLGSESQRDGALVRRLSRDDRVILSLDYRGDGFLGPAALLSDAAHWPRKIIAMTLARVGSANGPDLNRLAAIKAAAPDKLIYAAGGVRDPADLAALQHAGIEGALVASSLHNGKLTGAQLARL